MENQNKIELSESELLLESIINSINDIIHVIDKDFKILLANTACVNKNIEIGLERDMVGKKLINVYPFLKNKIISEYKKVFSSGKELTTSESTKINNKTYCTETKKTPVFYENKVVRVITTMRDITEKLKINEEFLQTKEKVEESEEKYRSMVELSPDGIMIINIRGRVTFVNKAFSDLTGFKQEELEAIHYTKLPTKPKPYGSSLTKIMSNVISGKKIEPVEFKWKHKNGELREGEARVKTIRVSGKIVGIQGVISDITERKHFEDTLKKANEELLLAKEKALENEEKYRIMVELSPDGIAAMNLLGKVIFVNQSFVKVTGFSKEELIGKHFTQMPTKPKPYKHSVRKIIGSVLSGKDIDTVELKWLHKSGETRIGEARIQSIKTRGRVVGLQAILTDITERREHEETLKKANEELIIAKEKAEESDRLKSAFLANMSHEIRTPMNAILGFAQLLNRDNISKERKDKYFDLIDTGGKRLLTIISDIVDISKIDANQLKIYKKEISLNNLIDNLYYQFSVYFANSGVILKVEKDLDDSESFIITDETRLIQILSNLIENAQKFTKKGTIEFGYTIHDNKLKFFVKDTGIGIKLKDQKMIFDRFSQAENLHSKSGKGTGLGLSIVKGLVELLGGEIWIESEEKKGTCFYFTILYESVKQKSITNNKKTDIEIKTIEKQNTLLIAEDELSNFIYIEELLEDYNFNIIHAKNGLEAVKLFKENISTIDLVLMDIKMPEMNGLEAVKQIRKFNDSTPIIALTAYAMSEDKIFAINAGCNDYLVKPISEEVLYDMIIQYIRKA